VSDFKTFVYFSEKYQKIDLRSFMPVLIKSMSSYQSFTMNLLLLFSEAPFLFSKVFTSETFSAQCATTGEYVLKISDGSVKLLLDY
jgi:hypothetical protein